VLCEQRVYPQKVEAPMPAREQFQSRLTVDPELKRLLDEARTRELSEDELREQRISFAFGNAMDSELITKESVRHASNHLRLTDQ
jgi:hypothetical protein